jgi:hypothetical protein
MEHRVKPFNPKVAAMIRALREDMQREFGLIAVLAGKLLGPVLWWTSYREDKRLAAGQSYEPATIVDRRNWEAAPGPQGSEPVLERPMAPDLITLG